MSSFDRLVELIDERNTLNHPLTRNNVRFDSLTVDAEAQWNTRVTARAILGGEYRGNVDLFYTRANLTALGTLEFSQETPFTIADLLTKINTQATAQITAEDLTNPILPVMVPGVVYRFQISATSSSLAWLGNAQVTLLSGIPDSAPALNAYMNNLGNLFK